MIELEYDETVALLDRAVAEMGEDHTAGDQYFKDGQPHCIVGHVLAYKGLDINSSEYGGEFPFEGAAVDEIRMLHCDDKSMELLTRVQDFQDEGWYWGNAVEDAKIETESVNW